MSIVGILVDLGIWFMHMKGLLDDVTRYKKSTRLIWGFFIVHYGWNQSLSYTFWNIRKCSPGSPIFAM